VEVPIIIYTMQPRAISWIYVGQSLLLMVGTCVRRHRGHCLSRVLEQLSARGASPSMDRRRRIDLRRHSAHRSWRCLCSDADWRRISCSTDCWRAHRPALLWLFRRFRHRLEINRLNSTLWLGSWHRYAMEPYKLSRYYYHYDYYYLLVTNYTCQTEAFISK